MIERTCQVEVTDSFLQRLQVIEAFLDEAQASFAYDELLADLRAIVIPNLSRFPRMGRPYLDSLPQSVESLGQLAALPAGVAGTLREYLRGDYLILYAEVAALAKVYLLTIRHHRELSFDFSGLWSS